MPGLTVHRTASAEMAHTAVAVVGECLATSDASQIAVLSRVASALLPVQVALGEAGISHSSPLDVSVLNRTGIRTALTYLRLGLDLERIRREDVLETINRPARKVKSAVAPLLPRGRATSLAGLESLTASLDETHRQRFDDYLGDLGALEGALTGGATTAECLTVIRERIGLGEAMDALDSSRSRPEGSSHGDDLDALTQLASLQPDPAMFATWLAERLRRPADPTGVTLSTTHRVKGREWDAVVVFAANQGLFPHRLADDLEEERRVFHVALTRCRRRVDVIADEQRCSPFVDELATEPPVGRTRPADPDTAAPTPPAGPARWLGADGLVAEAGHEVALPGGVTATIVAVADGKVHLADAGSRGQGLTVPLGTPALHAGRRGRLVAAPAATRAPAEAPVDAELFAALRAWRSRIAQETGVPAYLVFHDRHLQTIAARRPRTLRELAGCPGVGPAKLERFGDDVLDVLADHDAPPA